MRKGVRSIDGEPEGFQSVSQRGSAETEMKEGVLSQPVINHQIPQRNLQPQCPSGHKGGSTLTCQASPALILI